MNSSAAGLRPTRRLRRSRLSRAWSAVAYPFLGLAIIIFAWEFGVRIFHVNTELLPPFSTVITAAVEYRDEFLSQAVITLVEIAYGFALSVLIGLSLAILIVTFRPVGKGIYPLLVASQVVPKIAIAPLLLVWFGLGITPKVLIAFLLSFFPIVISSVLGLRSVQAEQIYLARSMGASAVATFLRLQLPNALPDMFVGFKIGATFAVTGAVVGEFVSTGDGLGRLILRFSSSGRSDLLFAGILYILAIGLAVFMFMTRLEQAAVPWHKARHERARGI